MTNYASLIGNKHAEGNGPNRRYQDLQKKRLTNVQKELICS